MDNLIRNQLLNELENLTRQMDVPIHRQKDPSWLIRNVGINNPGHKNLEKIIKICKLLQKENNNIQEIN
ncbi:hypothetical protein EB001_00215 [bacterium]|nr:hypothetical protein [bacterium]